MMSLRFFTDCTKLVFLFYFKGTKINIFIDIVIVLTLECGLLPGSGGAELDLLVLVVDHHVKGHGAVHLGAGGVELQLGLSLLLVLR